MTQELLADLRSRINPAYENVRGTESYERKQCADAIESLQSKLGDAIRSLANWQHQCDQLQAENKRLEHEKRKLYECTGCGHLHGEKPSSCDCLENPGNDYNDWTASPTPPEAA